MRVRIYVILTLPQYRSDSACLSYIRSSPTFLLNCASTLTSDSRINIQTYPQLQNAKAVPCVAVTVTAIDSTTTEENPLVRWASRISFIAPHLPRWVRWLFQSAYNFSTGFFCATYSTVHSPYLSSLHQSPRSFLVTSL